MSKILESVVKSQFKVYLKNKGLLDEYQSGIRCKFSMETYLIFFNDVIRNEACKGNFTGMVLIDIKKAFDSVNHLVLCSKLKGMGVSPDSVEWF